MDPMMIMWVTAFDWAAIAGAVKLDVCPASSFIYYIFLCIIWISKFEQKLKVKKKVLYKSTHFQKCLHSLKNLLFERARLEINLA